MYSLHLTHPKWTHTRSSGQPCYSARGAVGGSVPCSRTPQSWYWRRILPPPTIPAGPEIRTHNLPLTSPTRNPLGHDCPLYRYVYIYTYMQTYMNVLHICMLQEGTMGLRRHMHSGLAKSLARRPGAIMFSSRATKMYHRPAQQATLNTGLPRNVPSKLHARSRTLLQPRPCTINNVPLARKN